MFIPGMLILLAACGDPPTLHVGTPTLSVPVSIMDFDQVTVGIQSTGTLPIYNVGKNDLHIYELMLSVAGTGEISDVSIDIDEIPMDGQALISATYAPTDVGEDWATVSFTTDDPEHPTAEITLTGFGVIPKLEIDPEILWFGDVPEDDYKSLPVTLSAVGTGRSRITGIIYEPELSPNPFSYVLPFGYDSFPFDLEAGVSIDMAVTFAPTDVAPYDINLLVLSNDPDLPAAPVELIANAKVNPKKNNPPMVEITSPHFGMYLVVGETVTLQGQVVDYEDRPENLVCMWYYDGNNYLGGSNADSNGLVSWDTDLLPAGSVEITLKALDTGSLMGQDSVEVVVWDDKEPIQYTISGGVTPFDYWAVDDDVMIYVDGAPIFQDANHTQDTHPPVDFDAVVGSEIRIEASDYNYCRKSLGALYLHFGSGSFQPLNSGICGSACPEDICYDGSYFGPWPNVFFDQSYTIQIP